MDVSNIDELCGDAICIDWDCSNCDATNQWSVFEIDDFGKNEELDKTVIYLLYQSFNKYKEGISFLFFEKTLFNDLGSSLDQELKNLFGIRHYNIDDVKYKHFKKAIKKTFDTCNSKIVTYDTNELKTLLKRYLSLDSSTRDSLEKALADIKTTKNKNDFLKKLDSNYFPDKEFSFIEK